MQSYQFYSFYLVSRFMRYILQIIVLLIIYTYSTSGVPLFHGKVFDLILQWAHNISTMVRSVPNIKAYLWFHRPSSGRGMFNESSSATSKNLRIFISGNCSKSWNRWILRKYSIRVMFMCNRNISRDLIERNQSLSSSSRHIWAMHL